MNPIKALVVCCSWALSEVAPLHFPMYTVSVERLLKMTAVEPHEKLKARLCQRNRETLHFLAL